MKIELIADTVIDMYKNRGMNTVQIAREIGCSDSGVGRLLERHGIKRTHTPNELIVSADMSNEICRMYSEGMSTLEIGGVYHICDASVAKVLRQNGVELRRAVRRSKIKRHDFFSVIDTVEKAYFLGWMISDGAVIENRSREGRSKAIRLEIQESDIDVLFKFAKSLGADESCVKTFKPRGHSHISFSSESMAKDLSQFGVVPRKSSISFLPMLSKEMMPHLIRGIFDGDGTVTITCRNGYKYSHFGFYGSKELCENISQFLHDEIGINKNKVSKSTCYHVWWGGKTPSKAFYQYIYNDCDIYCLDRKRNKFIVE